MSKATEEPSRVIPRRLLGLLLLFGTMASAILAAAAFQYGLSTGLAAGAALYVVYVVPATIFDWPRVTLTEILGFFVAIVAFICSLFDW